MPLKDSIGTSEVRRSPGGELSALGVLFGLTLRQQTRGRKLLVLVVLYALPCVLALVLRSLSRSAPTDILEFALIYNLVPHALAPLTALLYAGGMIQDEVEEQTLTYLLVRQLPRPALYVCKLLATLLLTTILVAVATTGLHVAIYWNTTQMWDGSVAKRMAQTVAIMSLGQVGYCSLFGCLGVLTRRTLIAGVVYVVVFEGLLANLQFMVRSLTGGLLCAGTSHSLAESPPTGLGPLAERLGPESGPDPGREFVRLEVAGVWSVDHGLGGARIQSPGIPHENSGGWLASL